MKLKTRLYCSRCGLRTVQEWVGIQFGYWIFKCPKCGREEAYDPNKELITWVEEQEAEEDDRG